jgi:hypothetical protein
VFKPGDIVRCKSVYAGLLQFSGLYKVIGIFTSRTGESIITVKTQTIRNGTAHYSTSMFEPANDISDLERLLVE